MLGIEGVSLVQIVATEDFGIGIAEQLLTEEVTDGVVDYIAQHGRDDQYPGQGMDVQHAAHGEGTGGKQQGVTRQERRHYQPGFTEDDQKQDGVNPDAIVLEQLFQMHVNVQDKVDSKEDQIHFFHTHKVNGVESTPMRSGSQSSELPLFHPAAADVK